MTYIPKKRREEAATVHVDGKAKYPIDSKHTAKSALRLINNAKPPLTPSQKATVRKDAAKYGVHPASSSSSSAKKKGTKS
jgi:hypothetical protein